MARRASGLCRPANPRLTMRRNLVSLSVHPTYASTIFLSVNIVLVRGLAERKIVKIACGSQHAIALDSEGYAHLLREHAVRPTHSDHRRVYGWGYNGYCRLGLGNQQDALVPKLIPQVWYTFVVGNACSYSQCI